MLEMEPRDLMETVKTEEAEIEQAVAAIEKAVADVAGTAGEIDL